MDTIGRQLIMDMWDCHPDMLRKRDVVEHIMVNAAVSVDADIREVSFHQFEPEGVSGTVVIAESHLSIHTFPEHGYASVDIYTCGNTVNPHDCMEFLVKHLECKSPEIVEVVRGVRPLKVETKEYTYTLTT